MPGVITTSSHPKLLWPGLQAIWGQVYDQWTDQWEALVDTGTSDKAYEEQVQIVDFGLAPIKPEGSGVSYDSEIQGPVSRWTNVTYALGYIVTMEELQDNLYAQVGADRTRSLAQSMLQTKENIVANLYNNGFTTNGADGVPMFSASHPNTTGGTFSNLLATASDLSEAALEDLTIQIMGALNDRGLNIALRPVSVQVPRAYYYQLTRILKSQFKTNTANNDVNAIAATGTFPQGGYVNQYLSSQTAWFIRTNIVKGQGKLLERMAATFDQDNDFDTVNAKAKGVERYSVNYSDPRWVFGSAG